MAPFAGSAMISPLDDEKTRNEDTVQIMLAEQGGGGRLQLLQKIAGVVKTYLSMFNHWDGPYVHGHGGKPCVVDT